MVEQMVKIKIRLKILTFLKKYVIIFIESQEMGT